MACRLRYLFFGLVAAIAMSGAFPVAADDFLFESGTYARDADWCLRNRADPAGPDYREKRAYINLTESEINWNQSVGKITSVATDHNKVTLSLQMTTDGKTEQMTLPLVRKSKKVFVIVGVNYYRCNTYMPNPWLGR
jgi:hypothetical protein